MLSAFFINRPIFASVLSIVIVLTGLIALPFLPVEKTPDITPPTVIVHATYPGANAQIIAQTVATPLEQAINGVDNMLYMSSSSNDNGMMELTVTFEVGTDIDNAAVLVQNRVATAQSRLPEEVIRQGITTQKQSSDITLVVSLYSPDKSLDPLYLSNYINLRMKDALLRVPGVGDIQVFGAKDFAMRIWLDPEKLKARNLTTTDVIAIVREQNVQVAAGQIGSAPAPQGQQFQFTVKTLGRLSSAEEFGNIIIKAETNGKILKLKDIAKIELGSQAYYWDVKLNGKPAVAMGIFQSPGANALSVAQGVKDALDELSKSFPPGLAYHIPYNPTTFISESIKEILVTLLETFLLVVLTVYIFLEDWRATLVPAITIPVSLIGTFAVMLTMGMSINTLTMFGLVLVIGIVVDDAIVVVENVSRIIEEESLPAKEATFKAMTQIVAPIIATTLVLLAVFLPTVVMGGITGQLYRQFGITISVAVVFSAINALTLSPALCALLLKPRKGGGKGLIALFDRFMKKTTSQYTGAVSVLIRKSAIVMVIFLIMVVLSVAGLVSLPTGFLPDEDEGIMFVNVRLPDGATIERTREVMDKVGYVLSNTSGIKDYVAVSGFSILDNAIIPNGAVCFINLQPWSERQSKELQLANLKAKLQQQFFTMPDAFILVFSPPSIRVGRANGFELQLQDRGGLGLEALENAANGLLFKAYSDPMFDRPNSTFRMNIPQLYVDIDRAKAKAMGIELGTVFNTLQTYLGSFYVNDFTIFDRPFRVMAQADSSFRNTADDIGRLEVRNSKGQMVPLKTFTKLTDTVGPQAVTHYNLYPSTTFSGGTKPGYSSGQAIDRMRQLCNETLPAGIEYEWSGMSLQEILAGNQAPKIFMIAAIFAFLFLAAQYESWSIPLSIMFSVPLALLGSVLFTWARSYDNNIYTQIGIVLLIGLAAKTAILLIEFAKQHHDEEGYGIEESAIAGAKLRFRPILMTALTTVCGAVPLAFATGAGAAARRALGTAVAGGMLIATFLGVLMLPVFYVVVQKTADAAKRKFKTIHHK